MRFIVLILLNCIAVKLHAFTLVSWNFDVDAHPSSSYEAVTASAVNAHNVNLISTSPSMKARSWLGGFNASRYYSFSFANNGDYDLDITELQFDCMRIAPGVGPTNIAIRSSKDGFTEDLINEFITDHSVWENKRISLDHILNPNDHLEFRIIAWGANSVPPQGGHLLVDNIEIAGAVVPETSMFTLVLGCSALFATLSLRRNFFSIIS